MSFDLNSLALRETTEYHLRHPVTGEPLYDDKGNAVISHLYGPASKQSRNAFAAASARDLKRKQTNKKLSATEINEEAITLLVACSEKIDHLEYNGKPVDNPDAFRELYSDPKFSWLLAQHDAAIGDTSSFLDQ